MTFYFFLSRYTRFLEHCPVHADLGSEDLGCFPLNVLAIFSLARVSKASWISRLADVIVGDVEFCLYHCAIDWRSLIFAQSSQYVAL